MKKVIKLQIFCFLATLMLPAFALRISIPMADGIVGEVEAGIVLIMLVVGVLACVWKVLYFLWRLWGHSSTDEKMQNDLETRQVIAARAVKIVVQFLLSTQAQPSRSSL